jgi:hypothetical protein
MVCIRTWSKLSKLTMINGSLNLKDCPSMSKDTTKYPYDSCTGLKPLSGHAGFPEHAALKLTYIYDKKQNSCAQFHNRNYEIFTQTQACRLVHQVCCGKAFPREFIKDFRT